MKTVSEKLISSKPISLSKAAKILSGFAGHEHGASDAVSVYLDCAADAFNSLVSFHKDLKNPHSYFKHGTPRVKTEENPDVGKVESRGKSNNNADSEVEVDGLGAGLAFEGNGVKDLVNERISEKEHKKKVKTEKISDEDGEEMKEKRTKEKLKIEESMDIGQATPDPGGEKRKKKKHKKQKMWEEEATIKIELTADGESGEKETQVIVESRKEKIFKQEVMEIEQLADEIQQDSGKKRDKKKRKRKDDEDAGESMELVKRKSKDVDDGVAIDLAEQNGKKKKKRRKTETED